MVGIYPSNLFKKDLIKLKKENSKSHSKVLELIIDIETNYKEPLKGIGKPEKLKGNYQGFYSRRIDKKNRLIYGCEDSRILLVSCYGHYTDR